LNSDQPAIPPIKPAAARDTRSAAVRTVLRLAIIVLLASGNSSRADRVVWQSGFESGFPGTEWLNLDNGAYSPPGTLPPGRTSAWTIVNRRSGEPVFSGEHAYKGWITGQSASSHRAYPVVHLDIQTPLVNTFMVYLDADYRRMSPTDWIHFGTWGNHDPDTKSGVWALHTMAVRDRKLEFAHVTPFHGTYVGPLPQSDFPVGRWVRLTVYILYQGNNGLIQVWQDGVPMLRAAVTQLERGPGTKLRTAHWGMYGSGTLDHGVQYNDDISICTLAAPLADLTAEPKCPASRTVDPR
jgi:hypothetical protein